MDALDQSDDGGRPKALSPSSGAGTVSDVAATTISLVVTLQLTRVISMSSYRECIDRPEGLEMSQNALRLSWPREEVDARLLSIMQGIHGACVRYGRLADGSVSYLDGANIAGFVKVADAMLAQGVT